MDNPARSGKDIITKIFLSRAKEYFGTASRYMKGHVPLPVLSQSHTHTNLVEITIPKHFFEDKTFVLTNPSWWIKHYSFYVITDDRFYWAFYQTPDWHYLAMSGEPIPIDQFFVNYLLRDIKAGLLIPADNWAKGIISPPGIGVLNTSANNIHLPPGFIPSIGAQFVASEPTGEVDLRPDTIFNYPIDKQAVTDNTLIKSKDKSIESKDVWSKLDNLLSD